MPEVLNIHGSLTLLLTVGAIVLFTRDRIPLETSALAVLVLLVVLFELLPFSRDGNILHSTEFFSGFGHEALVSICALMIMGRGLERTAALQPVAFALARAWPRYPTATLLVTLVVGALLSGFVNNTPIVIMLLPMLVAVGLENDFPPSRILLPMGLATIVGGMATTIGTSTNLLVVSIAADMGMRNFGMFDFSIPVLIAGSLGIIFLWLIAPRILPEREPPLTDTSPRIFAGRIRIDEDSKVAGLTFAEALDLTNGRMRVEEIQRGENLFLMKLPTVVLKPGDRLLVNDTPENLKLFEQQLGTTLGENQREEKLADEPAATGDDGEQQKLAEIAVTSGSLLDNRKLVEVGFENRFKLLPVALHHAGSQVADIANTKLSVGDVLLVQGESENIEALKRSAEVMVLDGITDLPVQKKARLALAIMGAVVAAAAIGLAPISVAAIVGVLAMLLTRCLSWSDAGEALSIPVIMIIVTSLALGQALIATGGAEFLAELFLNAVEGLSLGLVLAILMISMTAVTNIVSNNAAAIIGTPVAVDIALGLNAPIEPFLLAIIFGANMSFATPIGYKTNLLVMSAGGYRFSDFLRVGMPLTLIMWVTLSLLLLVMYDL